MGATTAPEGSRHKALGNSFKKKMVPGAASYEKALYQATEKEMLNLNAGGNLLDGVPEDTAGEIREIFVDYSKLGAAENKLSSLGARAQTMDFHEFLACMKHFGVLGRAPATTYGPTGSGFDNNDHNMPVDKTFLASLFRAGEYIYVTYMYVHTRQMYRQEDEFCFLMNYV